MEFLTGTGVYIFAAFLVAGISASFGLPFQALYYLLAVVYAVNDVASFGLITIFYIVVILFAHLYRASTKR